AGEPAQPGLRRRRGPVRRRGQGRRQHRDGRPRGLIRPNRYLGQGQAFAVTRTGRLVELREYTLDDAVAMTAWTSDPEVVRFLTWGVGDRGRARQFIEQKVAESEEQPRSVYELAVIERATGLVVGGAGLRVRDWRHRRADLGYVLRRDRWGRGY